jgi:hypothetical protein
VPFCAPFAAIHLTTCSDSLCPVSGLPDGVGNCHFHRQVSKLTSTVVDIILRDTSQPSWTSTTCEPWRHFGFGRRIALPHLSHATAMLRISTIETKSERRLVVEGKLVEPWLAELKRSWCNAGEGLEGRKLVIDLHNVTVISSEGESVLYELMQEGAQFSCGGVLTRHLLKRLAHRCQAQVRNLNRICSSD